MKKLCYGIIAVISLSTTPLHAQTYTLETCFELALKKSHTLAIQTEQIDQAEAQIRASRAVSLPSFSIDTSVSYQDAPDNNQAETFFPSNQTTSKIQMALPLFKGFRDLATLKQHKFEKKSQAFEYDNAVRTLKADVTEAYFTTLALQTDLALYTKEIQANENRKKELVNQKKLARVREIDIVTVEATIASLEANKETIIGQLQASKVLMSFLTDLPITAMLSIPTLSVTAIPSLSYWTTDIDNLPSLQKQAFDIQATQQLLKVAKSAYYPYASFNTNYYVTRPGIFSDIQWDMGVSISIPFFAKETVKPKVKQAESKLKQAEHSRLQLRETERYTLETTYTQMQATQLQLVQLQKALRLAQNRYTLLVQDNQQGLSTNLDVLQALTSLYQTQRQKEHTEIMCAFLIKKLELLSGKRSQS